MEENLCVEISWCDGFSFMGLIKSGVGDGLKSSLVVTVKI